VRESGDKLSADDKKTLESTVDGAISWLDANQLAEGAPPAQPSRAPLTRAGQLTSSRTS